MSISVARRKRSALFLSITGLMFIVAAISAISAREPDGLTIRTGMILVTVGAAMWLPWQALVPATLAIWLGPNFARNAIEGYDLFSTNMMLELPGFLGLAAVSTIARMSLRDLERQNLMLGMTQDTVGVDPVTGVYEENQLRRALEMELSRSRRFGRTFALVLAGIDEMRQRFDYRDEAVWQASFTATGELLRGTRANVDRVYRYGPAGFALVLPESGPKDVNGLIRRLRQVARKAKPQEGEPGGPLPVHFGATFFPTCATSVEDLIRRAEIAVKIAESNASRVQLDGAEAPELPPATALRQIALEDATVETTEEALVETAPAVESAPVATLRLVPPETEDEQEAHEPEPAVAYATTETHLDAEPAPLQAAADNGTPAVVYSNKDWQTEAPLSVLRRSEPAEAAPQLVALNGGQKQPSVSVDDAISDALKQLDGTLELIRSLKQQRSA